MLPLNADYLENKLGTPIFFYPDLKSALNFISENQSFKKGLILFPKVGSHLNHASCWYFQVLESVQAAQLQQSWCWISMLKFPSYT